MNAVSNNHVPGSAIYLPVCAKSCCDGQKKIHHLTLAHVTTRDSAVIQHIIARMENCIESNWHLTQDSKGNKTVAYKLGTEHKNSTLLEGKVEDFKFSLHEFLAKDPQIKPYLSDYRPAHIDRYNRDVKLYKEFRVSDLKTMKA